MIAKRIGISLLLLIACTSCTRQTGMNVLTFFFDGVPADDTVHSLVAKDSLSIAALNPGDSLTLYASLAPEMNYHEPYQKKECLSCHDENAVGNLVDEEPGLCYRCHERYSEKFKYLHGPVDAGFCSTCHEPHMSVARKLLHNSGNSLCFPCHISYEIEQPSTHVEIGLSLCTECHDPHGENRRPREKIKLTR